MPSLPSRKHINPIRVDVPCLLVSCKNDFGIWGKILLSTTALYVSWCCEILPSIFLYFRIHIDYHEYQKQPRLYTIGPQFCCVDWNSTRTRTSLFFKKVDLYTLNFQVFDWLQKPLHKKSSQSGAQWNMSWQLTTWGRSPTSNYMEESLLFGKIKRWSQAASLCRQTGQKQEM